MSAALEHLDVASAVAVLHHALDVLLAADTQALGDDDSVRVLRDFEQARRRMEAADHALIMNIETRGLPADSGSRSTGNWLRATLLVDIHEGNARARAARAAGPRRSLLGEALPARYPVVAAGQAAGAVGAKQARVITGMLDQLPPAVCEEVPAAEARLVGFCATLDANTLTQAAEHERAWLDPDGAYREPEQRRRDRDLRFTARPDGSCTGSFEGTAELAEYLQSVFDSLGGPKPESNGITDPRSAGQRRHDALLDALKVTVSSGSLPTTGGVLATVVLTMTEDAYKTGQGFARTGHGAQVPVREAMSWAGGDYRLFTTVLNSVREVIAYSTCHRFYTESERLALIARDRGCSFPGCDTPPGLDPSPPHHRMANRQTHLRRRRLPALRLPPPRVRTFRLAGDHARRPTSLDPTPLHRPRPDTHPRLRRQRSRCGPPGSRSARTRGRSVDQIPILIRCRPSSSRPTESSEPSTGSGRGPMNAVPCWPPVQSTFRTISPSA